MSSPSSSYISGYPVVPLLGIFYQSKPSCTVYVGYFGHRFCTNKYYKIEIVAPISSKTKTLYIDFAGRCIIDNLLFYINASYSIEIYDIHNNVVYSNKVTVKEGKDSIISISVPENASYFKIYNIDEICLSLQVSGTLNFSILPKTLSNLLSIKELDSRGNTISIFDLKAYMGFYVVVTEREIVLPKNNKINMVICGGNYFNDFLQDYPIVWHCENCQGISFDISYDNICSETYNPSTDGTYYRTRCKNISENITITVNGLGIGDLYIALLLKSLVT